MIAYHGCSITNLIGLVFKSNGWNLYVTDTAERATRYANAQATGSVSKSYDRLAEGAAVVEVECDDDGFIRRPESHSTLDTAETIARNWRITRVILRTHNHSNTHYGDWRRGHAYAHEITTKLRDAGIEVCEQH